MWYSPVGLSCFDHMVTNPNHKPINTKLQSDIFLLISHVFHQFRLSFFIFRVVCLDVTIGSDIVTPNCCSPWENDRNKWSTSFVTWHVSLGNLRPARRPSATWRRKGLDVFMLRGKKGYWGHKESDGRYIMVYIYIGNVYIIYIIIYTYMYNLY